MNVLWFTRRSPGGLEVVIAGKPVPDCFAPSADLIDMAARNGLGVRCFRSEEAGEDGWEPTDEEVEAAEEIVAALRHQLGMVA